MLPYPTPHYPSVRDSKVNGQIREGEQNDDGETEEVAKHDGAGNCGGEGALAR